jgi:hypothetical protein
VSKSVPPAVRSEKRKRRVAEDGWLHSTARYPAALDVGGEDILASTDDAANPVEVLDFSERELIQFNSNSIHSLLAW